MNQPLLNSIESFDLQDRVVALETEQFDRAEQVSDPLPTEKRQWKTYLNGLALIGFEQWLSQRAPDLAIQTDSCSVLSPPVANVVDAVSNLEINGFKVCLLVMERRDNETVSIPRIVVNLPEFVAHFYVLIEVLEEESEVLIHSVLRYDQLITRQAAHPLRPQPDWTYLLPLSWFDWDLTAIVLPLRCGEFYHFSLPKAPARLASLSQYRASITTALSQSSAFDRPLWEVLSWEEGMAFLTSPELVNWYYQQQLQPSSNLESSLQSLLNHLTQQAINGWNLMNETLDKLALRWGWFMQPTLAPVGALRGDASYEKAITALNERGIKLPLQEQNACIDLELGNEKLRLRAIPIPATVLEDSSEGDSEWRLFVLLEAQPDYTLSEGVMLQMSDEGGVLAEKSFDQQGEDNYIFSCVVGSQEEQFTVSIRLANGLSLTLPPFSFQPE